MQRPHSSRLHRQVRPDAYLDPEGHGTGGKRTVEHIQPDDMASLIDAHMLARPSPDDARNVATKIKPPTTRVTAIWRCPDRQDMRIDAHRPDRQDMGAGVRWILRESSTPSAWKRTGQPLPTPPA